MTNKSKSTELIEFLEQSEAANGPGACVGFNVGYATGYGPGVIPALRNRGFIVEPNPRGGWKLRRPVKKL